MILINYVGKRDLFREFFEYHIIFSEDKYWVEPLIIFAALMGNVARSSKIHNIKGIKPAEGRENIKSCKIKYINLVQRKSPNENFNLHIKNTRVERDKRKQFFT